MAIATTVWTAPVSSAGRLEGAHEADVAIVGAGIVGLALARMLAEHGADVVVVDRHRIGEGVTGRSTAKVTALHQIVYRDVRDRHGAPAARAYASGSQAAVAWVREAAGPLWQARDAVTVARTTDEGRIVSHEVEAATRAGLRVVLEAEAVGWDEVISAVRLPDQGQVDPVALLQRLAANAPASVRIFEGSVVTGVRERPDGATVVTPAGRVTARHVVVATGLPVLDRGGFFGLCEPSASYLVALRHPGGGGDMLITADEPTRSVRWVHGDADTDRVVLVGGEGHRTGTGGSTVERYERLERWAREHLPGVGEVVARWSAEDFMPIDRLPFAGPHYRFGGPVQIVTGLAKWGLSLGVACAQALAGRLTGAEPTAFARLVDTARLPDLQGAGKLVKANAEVGRHMVRDWVEALGRPLDRQPEEGQGSTGRDGVKLRAACRVGGRTHELSAVCTHLGGIVHWNDGDQTWDCPLHGSRFTADGDVRHGPAIRGL